MQKLRYEHFLAENTVKNVYYTIPWPTFIWIPEKKGNIFFIFSQRIEQKNSLKLQ